MTAINTTGFVLKTKYGTDKAGLERKSMTLTKKYLIFVDLLKTDYNAKISEIEGKIYGIAGLAATAALTAVENKIPNISNLVKNKQIMI